MEQQITVLVHGTYANPWHDKAKKKPKPGEDLPEKWWRLSNEEEGGGATTADLLKKALGDGSDPTLAATVWEPNAVDSKDGEFGYEDLVEWSGNNRHKDRLKAGRELATAVESVANLRGCTEQDKLVVNYVAHSHGGNVVLESLNHPPKGSNVEVRSVNLLGTPLAWRYFDPRVLYIGLILLWTYGWAITMTDDGFWFNIGFTSLAFWTLYRVVKLLRSASKKLVPGGRPAYGPRPEELASKVTGGSLVRHLTSQDEADLMMHLGSSPMETYYVFFDWQWFKDIVSKQKKITFKTVVLLPLRLLEVALIRPFVFVVIVPILELLLENRALGFRFRDVLVWNHAMVTYSTEDPYDKMIDRESWTPEQLRARPRDHMTAAELKDEVERLNGEVVELQKSAVAVLCEPGATECREDRKKKQDQMRIVTRKEVRERMEKLKYSVNINLSHSDYYQNGELINDVAKRIKPKSADDPQQPGGYSTVTRS